VRINPRATAAQGIGFGVAQVAAAGLIGLIIAGHHNPVSVQGVGYSPQLLAVQGFAPTAVRKTLDGPLRGLHKYAPATMKFVSAEIKIPAVRYDHLIGEITASGSAQVRLLPAVHEYESGDLLASGAAQTRVVYVEHATQVGKILAEGRHDLSDDDILALLLTDILA
jgi:hypothetical protein